MKFYVKRLPDGTPTIIYRSDGKPDGDSYINRVTPDWTPDKGDLLLGMLTSGEFSLDNLDPKDVDATIAAIRARKG